MGNRYADHVTPLYPQKLALTSPTGSGRSVGIVRSRTKATEFSFLLLIQTAINSTVFGLEAGLTFKRRIKSHLPFAGIIRSSPYSPR